MRSDNLYVLCVGGEDSDKVLHSQVPPAKESSAVSVRPEAGTLKTEQVQIHFEDHLRNGAQGGRQYFLTWVGRFSQKKNITREM